MKRLFATLALFFVLAASVSACAVYEAPPPRYAYGPGYYAHYHDYDGYHHHHW